MQTTDQVLEFKDGDGWSPSNKPLDWRRDIKRLLSQDNIATVTVTSERGWSDTYRLRPDPDYDYSFGDKVQHDGVDAVTLGEACGDGTIWIIRAGSKTPMKVYASELTHD